MVESIINQFNNSVLNNPSFNYGEKKIRYHLTLPPFLPQVFLGREEDLQAIHGKLFNGNNVLLLVNGHGGVGKTSLATMYYVHFHDKYAHLAWILSEQNIIHALINALSEPLGLNQVFTEKMSTDERLRRLIIAMSELNKPCLLVVDNANDIVDLERNYQNLRRCHNFHLLLTTRITEFEQAERYRIEGLPEKDALALFKNIYPKLRDDEIPLFQQIRTAVDNNTLVIELLAKNLKLLNKLKTSYTLAELLADIQTKGLLALSKSQFVGTDYQSKGTLRKEKPEEIIAAMSRL